METSSPAVTIGLRKAFSNATAEGLGIAEMKSDPKATSEMYALHDAVFQESFVKTKVDKSDIYNMPKIRQKDRANMST